MLYKTKNGMQTGFVPGVGEIVGGQIDSPVKLEGANLVEVTEVPTPQPQITAQEVASAALAASPPPQAQPTASNVQNTNISTEATNG